MITKLILMTVTDIFNGTLVPAHPCCHGIRCHKMSLLPACLCIEAEQVLWSPVSVCLCVDLLTR